MVKIKNKKKKSTFFIINSDRKLDFILHRLYNKS